MLGEVKADDRGCGVWIQANRVGFASPTLFWFLGFFKQKGFRKSTCPLAGKSSLRNITKPQSAEANADATKQE